MLSLVWVGWLRTLSRRMVKGVVIIPKKESGLNLMVNEVQY